MNQAIEKGFITGPSSAEAISKNKNTTIDPSIKLYSPIKVLVAALLGGILGGAFLHWLNLKALKNEDKANQTLIWSIVLFFAFPIFAQVAHISFTGAGGAAAAAYMMDARKVYGSVYKEHANNNGKLGGWWATIGIGILSLAVSLVIAIPMAFVIALMMHR